MMSTNCAIAKGSLSARPEAAEGGRARPRPRGATIGSNTIML